MKVLVVAGRVAVVEVEVEMEMEVIPILMVVVSIENQVIVVGCNQVQVVSRELMLMVVKTTSAATEVAVNK